MENNYDVRDDVLFNNYVTNKRVSEESKIKYAKVLNPGWHVVWPIFETCKKIDIRTRAVDVPEQVAITSDNVSIKINAVIYYKVFDAGKALCEVENFHYAVGQLAQTTMRNVVGSVTFTFGSLFAELLLLFCFLTCLFPHNNVSPSK